ALDETVVLQQCCRHFFFFSSRRRHTRSLRDWSSDVCSSDLTPAAYPPRCCWTPWPRRRRCRTASPATRKERAPASCPTRRSSRRSEERRVGKECRSWWTPYD